MKFPKYRANIYVVVREDGPDQHTAILGTFTDCVEADNFKDSCAADWMDAGGPPYCKFDVRLSTHYG